ncbi:hypothetical protein Aph01nite_65190 [Acrocarpospora phusangensis]|uniref:Uncharacterized protein n=1 Tax=Acrocarpospora phusangensis TaxID=1070424 RepID=A0A919QHR1_9ACTN|nr:hypothetical protein [Acrocarpospora phusangensis]GIH28209.1 hypothetical protein Aph01nite_65190 [Acrocarpospora phusangensis]
MNAHERMWDHVDRANRGRRWGRETEGAREDRYWRAATQSAALRAPLTRREDERVVHAIDDLDIDQATAHLPTIVGEAREHGAITFVRDDQGERVAALVPVEIADYILRLRAEAEAIELINR